MQHISNTMLGLLGRVDGRRHILHLFSKKFATSERIAVLIARNPNVLQAVRTGLSACEFRVDRKLLEISTASCLRIHAVKIST